MKNDSTLKKYRLNRGIFLDRDGVINRSIERGGKPYPPTNIEDFEILPGVAKACEMLKQAGYFIFVVTNQPDVGRGTLKKEVVEEMHELLHKQLPIDQIETCYHPGGKQSNCDCRKPRPGMILKLASKYNIDLDKSWMIGDRWRDIDCGKAAGCKTILIEKGYKETLNTPPDFRAKDLLEAVTIIFNHAKLALR